MSPAGDGNATGIWGEELAAGMLRKKGYRILGMRVRLDSRDEIDIVARDDETLVFVEVKTRKSKQYGRPASSVKREKRHALSRAAVRYLKRIHFPSINFRFDVVEVTGSQELGDPELNHIENAFTLDRCYFVP
ncbi:MAG: YraN family protein [bacterium]